MKPIVFPNYKNSILNVSNSILKYYGAKNWHPTLSILDEYLSEEYRNVVLILIDGLGIDAIQKHLTQRSSIRKTLKSSISSVFPSTTVAATTAVLSGKSPIETGWFGWHQYFKEEDENVILFKNMSFYTPEKKFERNIANTYISYESIYKQINSSNNLVQTHEIFPAFRDTENTTINKLLTSAKKILTNPGCHFIYAYWDKVDSLMHEFGPSSDEVHKHIKEVNTAYKNFVQSIDDDTLVITIADHGQVDVEIIDLYKYQDVIDTLVRMPANESRATVFYVKPDCRDKFEELFTQYFREYFNLYSAQQLIDMNLFGYGIPHPKATEFLGDYVAIAIDHYIFNSIKEGFRMKGQHAGLLTEEMLVPLLIATKKSR